MPKIHVVFSADRETVRCTAKFRRFTKQTFNQYRHTPSRFIAMVTRFILWKRTGKHVLLGCFLPKLTLDQLELFLKLYEYLKKGPDADMNAFAPTVHRILYATFTVSTDARIQVATAVEQSLIFSILTSHPGVWLSPQVLCHLYCHYQRTCFTTFFHTAWLGGAEPDYQLETHTEDREEKGEEDEEDKDEERTVNSGVVLERELEDVEDEVEMVNFLGGGGNRADADSADVQQLQDSDFFELVDNFSIAGDIDIGPGSVEIIPQDTAENQILR